jgi:predicted glycosyltransferase
LKILVDIGHPAHVHLYKNLILDLKSKGHVVITTVKEIDLAQQLLTYYGIEFKKIGSKRDSLISKMFDQLKYNFIVWRLVRKNKIDIGLGSSMTLAHVSKISKMRSIVFDDDDDEVQELFVKYAHPFCDSLLSPDVLKGKRKLRSTIYYPGLHELAYLHPKRFVPDPTVLMETDIKPGEVFFILRFNAFKAFHDTDVRGLSLTQKLEIVEILKPFGKIFITTERDIEPELKQYQMKVDPVKIHSLLFYATMLIGDSQTMTSEAAVLGVPSIRCNSLAENISYLEELKTKYGLTFSYLPGQFEELKLKLTELLNTSELKEQWRKKRAVLLNDKIDVTGFMEWFVENYPDSKEMVKNDEIFKKFK